MVDPNEPDRLDAALEAVYFGFRALTAQPDALLHRLGYARVHHRILYFVARHPGCSVGELLAIMGVSKQYLHRPLRRLVEDGRVTAERDPGDRRIKRLTLTPEGRDLEARLTGAQKRRLAAVFQAAGAEAEAGWRRVMALLAAGEGE